MPVRTAVIYARFSCSKQREASIEDQLRECEGWCERNGYEVVGRYCDHAMSGRTDERPQFQRMIANAGESDIVLVYMMDRFSRDEFDAPIYKRELASKGVRLVSAMEAIPDSPEGIIYEKLLEGLAACESRKTSVRTKRGLEGNALKCQHNGVRVFGYKVGADGRYEVDMEQAAFVREAFKRHAEGEPVNAIARDFALRGVKSYTGSPCAYTMVYNMLKNEKYVGTYIWGDIRIEGGMPAIVDKELFMESASARPKKSRKDEKWGDFPLSGKAICDGCGMNLRGVSGRGRGGAKYDYYSCKSKCVKPVRSDWLEAEIVKVVREMLSERTSAVRIAEQVLIDTKAGEEAAAARKAAERALAEAERGIANLVHAMETGVDIPEIRERLDDLQAQKVRTSLQLGQIEGEEIDPEDMADFLQFGATLDDQTLLDAFVYQVLVRDDDITVTLNYDAEKDEPARFDIRRVRTDCFWLLG